MAFVVFAFSLVLLIAGLASGYMSLDLLPTGIGVLYAVGGAVGVSIAILTFALGVLVRRVDRLTKLVGRPPSPAPAYDRSGAASGEAFEAPPVETKAEEAEFPTDELEEPINANRAGRLPTFGRIEHAIEATESPPGLIGRYASGGASYMIFADGTIEAETGEGTFTFASMSDFKRYLMDRRKNA